MNVPHPVECVHVDVDTGEESLHGLVKGVAQQPDGAHLHVLGHLAQDDPHLLLHRLHRGACLHGDLHTNGEGLSLHSLHAEAIHQAHECHCELSKEGFLAYVLDCIYFIKLGHRISLYHFP